MRTAPGERGTRECCGHVRWHIFRRSLDTRIAAGFIPEDWEVLAGDHIKSASDLGFRWLGSDCFTGKIFSAAPGSYGVAGGEILETDVNQLPTPGRDREERTAGRGGNRDSQRCDSCQSLAGESGTVHLFLLDSDVEGNAADDRKLDLAALWREMRGLESRQELLLGVGGFRALKAMGHHARSTAPERRAQRICRAGKR